MLNTFQLFSPFRNTFSKPYALKKTSRIHQITCFFFFCFAFPMRIHISRRAWSFTNWGQTIRRLKTRHEYATINARAHTHTAKRTRFEWIKVPQKKIIQYLRFIRINIRIDRKYREKKNVIHSLNLFIHENTWKFSSRFPSSQFVVVVGRTARASFTKFSMNFGYAPYYTRWPLYIACIRGTYIFTYS